MFKVMGKETNAILGAQTILIWTHDIFLISQPDTEKNCLIEMIRLSTQKRLN